MAGLLDFIGGNRAQAPGSTMGGGLRGLLAPEVALPMAAALMGNQGNMQNIGNAFALGGQQLAQTAGKNRTMEFFRQSAPEFAQMIDAGMPMEQAWRTYTQQRFAQPSRNEYEERAAAAQQFGLEGDDATSFVLTGALPTGRFGAGEVGLQGIPGYDEEGNFGYAQLSKSGNAVPTVFPEGFQPASIFDKAREQAGGAGAGKLQAEASFDLPRVEQNAAQTLGVLERMKTHPGRAGSTGFIQGVLPSRTSDQVDFQSLVDQTQGQSFLQAFQMLKGGGQITEVEGQKATDAISRLRNQRLSDADYLRAITDLEEVIKAGLARARRQAGQGGVAAPAQGGANTTRSGVQWSVGP